MDLTAKHLEQAIIYSCEKHAGVIRKGNGKPYIMHPLSVMMKLSSVKSNTKNTYLLSISTLLHDVVEDCFSENHKEGLDEISKLFGFQVASIVHELTSVKSEVKEQGKKEYLLNKMLKMSSYSLCIKLCDRLDNLNDMDSMSEEFITKAITDTNFIINGLREGRKLTKTHKKIISLIDATLYKYSRLLLK